MDIILAPLGWSGSGGGGLGVAILSTGHKKYKGAQWESANAKSIVTKKDFSSRMSPVPACTTNLP